jgi:hypothetical protein
MGEFKIGPYFVDGISHEHKLIFEFNGCMYLDLFTMFNFLLITFS